MTTPDEELRDLGDDLWERMLESDPLIGTFVGDDRYDDRLPHIGPEARADAAELYQGADRRARAIDENGLVEDDRITLDLTRAVAARGLTRMTSGIDRFEVANPLNGPATILQVLASVQQAQTQEALDRYVARLAEIPRYFDEAIVVAREAISEGLVAPRVVVERTLGLLDRTLQLPPEESPALEPVGEDPAARERVLAEVERAVDPAHEGFRDVVRDELLPAAPEAIGLSSLAAGEALYAGEILGWTSLALNPAEIHELGRERFSAIQRERREVAEALGYAGPREAIEDHTARGENTLRDDAALLALVEDQVARSWEAAPSWFGRLPKANCSVKLVEPYRQADQPFAYYNPPTEDGSRPGTYYANPYELEERPLHHIAGVTFHEANPGHHFQISIEQEMPDRIRIRRYGGWFVGDAFSEGWGLYSERLADEMGMYLDEWERLGMLENQALRAARLITDTGIHALGWTREAAIAILEDGGTSPGDAAIEVDRYIGMPAQALCYMVGMDEIQRAREVATRGGQDLRSFHDAVLASGSLPLTSFRRVFGTDRRG